MDGFDKYNLTAAQMAVKLGYHPQHVRDLAAAGKIPALKRGRSWRFNEFQVMDFFRKQTDLAIKGPDNAESGDNILG